MSESCCSRNRKRVGLWCYRTFHVCCRFHRPPHLRDEPLDGLGYLREYGAKFLLEVCGAGGAVWGCSEVLTLRNPSNAERWRLAATSAAVVFLGRFWLQSKHYLEHEQDHPPVKLRHRRLHKLPFVQTFSAKFLLEVCGAAGAIWGSSHALKLRSPTSQGAWRCAAIVVGLAFGIRWIWLMSSYCLCLVGTRIERSSLGAAILVWFEATIVKFVLEVLGATGAVWGFSEVVLLNTAETREVWRYVAIGVGFLFMARWIWQVWAFWRNFLWTDIVTADETTAAEVQELELSEVRDLELSDVSMTDSKNPAPSIIGVDPLSDDQEMVDDSSQQDVFAMD